MKKDKYREVSHPEKKELRREAEGREPVMAGFGGTGVYRIPERCVGRGGTGGAFGVPCAPAMLPSGSREGVRIQWR